jgi:transcriptional regulator with XRE-family HTH domain
VRRWTRAETRAACTVSLATRLRLSHAASTARSDGGGTKVTPSSRSESDPHADGGNHDPSASLLDSWALGNTLHGNMANSDSLGDVLREARVKIDLSLHDLAKKLHLSPSYISDLENTRRVPTKEVLGRLADVLGLKMDNLMPMWLSPSGSDDPLDWRMVGYTIHGYELWGSFEECARVSNKVSERLRSRDTLQSLSLEELLTFLFFGARAERHSGETREDTSEEERVLDEIVRRKGVRWARTEVERTNRT